MTHMQHFTIGLKKRVFKHYFAYISWKSSSRILFFKKLGAKPNVVVNQYQAKIEVFQAEVVNLSTGALDNFEK